MLRIILTDADGVGGLDAIFGSFLRTSNAQIAAGVTAAQLAATNSANSAASASESAAEASGHEIQTGAYADAASASAQAAAQSESNASGSATAAGISATQSATSAGQSAGSASNANISAGNASASATLAQQWASQASGMVGGVDYSARYYAAIAQAAAASITLPIPVASGGTGATSAAAARTNLGAASLGANTFTGNQSITSTVLSIARANNEGQLQLGQNDGYFYGNPNAFGFYSPTVGSFTYTFATKTLSVSQIKTTGPSAVLGATQTVSGLELGDNSTTTSFTDYHSSGSGNDYDARILATGGTAGSNGSGTLSYNAATHQFNGSVLYANGLTIQNYSQIALSGAAYTGFLRADATGLVGFINNAGNQWNFQIYDDGHVVARGNIQAYSDERIKKNWEPLPRDVIAQVAKVEKSGTFERTDIAGRYVGVGAQSFQAIIPESVREANGRLAMDYGGTALALCVELCREVEQLRARIRELEQK